jgi:hypothetical protein
MDITFENMCDKEFEFFVKRLRRTLEIKARNCRFQRTKIQESEKLDASSEELSTGAFFARCLSHYTVYCCDVCDVTFHQSQLCMGVCNKPECIADDAKRREDARTNPSAVYGLPGVLNCALFMHVYSSVQDMQISASTSGLCYPSTRPGARLSGF